MVIIIIFLINEENDYRNDIHNTEVNLEYKCTNDEEIIKKIEKIEKIFINDKNEKIDNSNSNKNNPQFLRWSENSYHFDSFFYIYICY